MWTLILKFKIKGNLSYLSHLETVAMFQRALVRAGVEVCYTCGFNPRLRLSLPLPRPVGVESDEELLCVLIPNDHPDSVSDCRDKIASQLPYDCEIISAVFAKQKLTFQPESVLYEFPLTDLERNDKIKADVTALRRNLAAGPVIIHRRFPDREPSRSIDVADYIDSVECLKNALVVKCRITPAGTVRVDEIMQLLRIDASQLSAPVKRKSVQWKTNDKLFSNN